ncbi:phosphocarrier protein HPr [candidate division LCP-89 bacterium B3_LCP]|uniref:Phosphocarrier protein HPr n=1 Tax=candidate division LCP-89 bacterium B3_LCP TaxID=2012998 RepID=A0A532V0F7_UNCL8|nr:MAG: phosphocarrier protein HPr [candidate division LCP-89 bacterium B3_LCP]
MIRREVTILNELGIHARPASKIVKAASLSKANFWISKDGQKINGKSIMGVMMLAAEKGSTVVIEADGEGAEELIDQIVSLIENQFSEEKL